jgi:5,5'-dehydrodivanillate O-demethylase
MLKESENDALTRVGPGTLMGDLMRRYWQPIAGTSDLEKNPVKAVRILGDSLTLYRDRRQQLGLIGQRCAHRGVDMKFGIPEPDGLRCPYHGWLFDGTGQCLETPLEPEDSTFAERTRIPAYPVREMGGLIWAYLGPTPVPDLPRWDLFVRENSLRQIGATMIPCNWLECMENPLDSVHSVYLHGYYFQYLLERRALETGQTDDVTNRIAGRVVRKPTKIAFDRFEYGIMKRRLREGQSEDASDWRIGHPMVFPYMVRLEGDIRNEFQIRVPVDDTHTWHLSYQCFSPGQYVSVPEQKSIPTFDVPIEDENGQYILDYVLGQDMVAWWSQGDIADRTTEKLGYTDHGIIMYRQMLMEEAEKVRQGVDPINVFRTGDDTGILQLPVGEHRGDETFGRGLFEKGFALDDADRFSPVIDEVLDLYKQVEQAMLQPG